MSLVATEPVTLVRALYLALDLGAGKWKVASSVGLGQAPRVRTLAAGDLVGLAEEIRRSKERFGLAVDALVFSCYEAGRDGFWLHRALSTMGVVNTVVDSSSIEVSRRKRRAKSDKLDASKLLGLLMRSHAGDQHGWKVVRVPTPAQEAMRLLHREIEAAKRDRTRAVNRIKGLLATQGIRTSTRGVVPRRPESLRDWKGDPLSPALQDRLTREMEMEASASERIRQLERQRKHELRNSPDPSVAVARRLMKLRAIGPESAWTFAMEFFAWRRFRNVREVGALAGLCPTMSASGGVEHELGMSKSGNRRVLR